MTPQQALAVLSRCSSAGHFAGVLADADLDACRIAVQVLKGLVEPKESTNDAPRPAADPA